jgi:hypothetical protein
MPDRLGVLLRYRQRDPPAVQVIEGVSENFLCNMAKPEAFRPDNRHLDIRKLEVVVDYGSDQMTVTVEDAQREEWGSETGPQFMTGPGGDLLRGIVDEPWVPNR